MTINPPRLICRAAGRPEELTELTELAVWPAGKRRPAGERITDVVRGGYQAGRHAWLQKKCPYARALTIQPIILRMFSNLLYDLRTGAVLVMSCLQRGRRRTPLMYGKDNSVPMNGSWRRNVMTTGKKSLAGE